MRRIILLVTLCLVTATAGCVSTGTTRLTPNQYPPVSIEEVRLFLDTNELPAGCERIALIHASGSAKWTSERQMLRAGRKRAGKAGANAVAVRSIRDPDLATLLAAEFLDFRADRTGQLIGFRCPMQDGERIAEFSPEGP